MNLHKVDIIFSHYVLCNIDLINNFQDLAQTKRSPLNLETKWWKKSVIVAFKVSPCNVGYLFMVFGVDCCLNIEILCTLRQGRKKRHSKQCTARPVVLQYTYKQFLPLQFHRFIFFPNWSIIKFPQRKLIIATVVPVSKVKNFPPKCLSR
jgi:hypothetical protein